MAVDTRDKRMSIMSIGLPWRGVFPLADGSIGAGDRQIFLYLYSGIIDSPLGGVVTEWLIRARRRNRR